MQTGHLAQKLVVRRLLLVPSPILTTGEVLCDCVNRSCVIAGCVTTGCVTVDCTTGCVGHTSVHGESGSSVPGKSVVLNSNMAETLDSALSFLAARGPSAPALKSSEPEVEYVFVGLEPGSTAQLSSEIILKVRGCPPTHARTLTLAHDHHHHHHHYHRRRRRRRRQ